jgi:transposase, IS5 family
VDGKSFMYEISWDIFDESTYLMDYIEQNKETHEIYPKEVLNDKKYCNGENRKKLKGLSIILIAKPVRKP